MTCTRTASFGIAVALVAMSACSRPAQSSAAAAQPAPQPTVSVVGLVGMFERGDVQSIRSLVIEPVSFLDMAGRGAGRDITVDDFARMVKGCKAEDVADPDKAGLMSDITWRCSNEKIADPTRPCAVALYQANFQPLGGEYAVRLIREATADAEHCRLAVSAAGAGGK